MTQLMEKTAEQCWPIRLFKRSPLKQRKYREIVGPLGNVDRLRCLDIGGDNGVLSYLLRQRSGVWDSADLDPHTVASIRQLVGENVYQIDGLRTPFSDNTFDRVVIIDFLEHIKTDREFVAEMHRIIRPGGELIVNVPHAKNSLLRKIQLAIGQTDEKHGHVRPGYAIGSLRDLLEDRFEIISHRTYSKFFSEVLDTVITFVFYRLKGNSGHSQKGVVITGGDLARYRKLFRLYSMIYPVVWTFVQMDRLLFWCNGYMLIVKASVKK